jgi:hypothetical protein
MPTQFRYLPLWVLRVRDTVPSAVVFNAIGDCGNFTNATPLPIRAGPLTSIRRNIDMPWPEKVIRQFQIISPNPIESDFHGAYNKLLYTLFPPDTDFTVVPQYLKPASSKSSEYIVTFEVFFENKPVFILELKKPADLNFISSRRAADVQIRERLGDSASQLQTFWRG